MQVWLKQKHLAEDEDQATACGTHEEFAKFWVDFTAKDHAKFEDNHRSGWRVWAKKYQSYAAGVQDFMNDFQGMLDACRALGRPYAGAAIGIVTVLSVVSSWASYLCSIR